jgi:outer membrane lipoprotein carrier protein
LRPRARRRLLVVALTLGAGLTSADSRLPAQDSRLPVTDPRPTPTDTASAALLDRAARAYASARSIRAQFEQTLTNQNTKTSHVSRGEFFQGGPMRFAFRFTEPAGDAIVSDGSALWVYLPSSAKGQVLKLPGEAGHALDFLTEILSAPREHYTVKVLPDTTVGSHEVAVYALTPKETSAPFGRSTLWVGRADALLWMMEAVEPSGLVRRVQFSAIRTNVELPKGALTFVVQEGVQVIDQSALLRGKP